MGVSNQAPDVKAIRQRLCMSQPQFAERFGINLATLREWEHERRAPAGPARTLLILISRIPDSVLDALEAA